MTLHAVHAVGAVKFTPIPVLPLLCAPGRTGTATADAMGLQTTPGTAAGGTALTGPPTSCQWHCRLPSPPALALVPALPVCHLPLAASSQLPSDSVAQAVPTWAWIILIEWPPILQQPACTRDVSSCSRQASARLSACSGPGRLPCPEAFTGRRPPPPALGAEATLRLLLLLFSKRRSRFEY